MKVILRLDLPKYGKNKGIRERGAVGKSNVEIMAELAILEDIETGGKSNQCRYF